MTDAREALVARQRDEYGASWDVLVPEVGWTLGRIIESVIEDVLAEFDVTPRGPVARGLAQSAAGDVLDLGDFTQYAAPTVGEGDLWEYGVKWGDDGYVTNCGSHERAESRAAESYGDKVVRRIAARTILAGEWEEVPRG